MNLYNMIQNIFFHFYFKVGSFALLLFLSIAYKIY